MKTILVIRSSAMGDVAMTAPVLEVLCNRYGSEVRVIMLTPRFYEPFFFKSTNLEIYPIDLYGEHRGVSGIRRLYKELSARYSFDVIIDLNYKLYSRLLRRFFMTDGIPTFRIDKGREGKSALTRPRNKVMVQQETSIQRYVDVFVAAGFDIEVPNVLPVRSVRPVPEFAGVKEQGWIGIAPFAKHRSKTLPLATVRGVIERIIEDYPGVRIFIFGGGRAEGMVADSLVAWYSACTSAIGRCGLSGEIDLMSNLDVMLSMDSSAMHLCSLVGVPVVSVWGGTHPYAGFLGLGQSAADVVSLDLECRPCSVYGHRRCMRGDYACMCGISVGSIVSRIGAYV